VRTDADAVTVTVTEQRGTMAGMESIGARLFLSLSPRGRQACKYCTKYGSRRYHSTDRCITVRASQCNLRKTEQSESAPPLQHIVRHGPTPTLAADCLSTSSELSCSKECLPSFPPGHAKSRDNCRQNQRELYRVDAGVCRRGLPTYIRREIGQRSTTSHAHPR
jgi:hypothetical protein